MNYIYSFKGKINYIINLKFELISVLQAISIPRAEWLYKDTEYFNMLLEEIDLTNENTIKLKNYLKEHLYFSELALIINSVNEKKYDIEYLSQIKEYGKSLSTLKKIINLLEKFFDTIDLQYLYNKYKSFYLKNLKEVSEYYNKFNINKVNEFYNNYEYNLNLNVSFISGNFGIKYKNNIFAIIKFPLDRFKIILNLSRINFIFHEFSHPFVNDLINKYFNKLNFVDKHQKLIYNDSLYQYHNAYNLLEEIIVRSNECYLAFEYLGKEKMQTYINKQINLKIFYFPDLINILFEKFALYSDYEQFFLKEIIPFYQKLIYS